MVNQLPEQPWSVYLLACRGGRIYTGIAVDVQARLVLHQSGKGARFTRAHPPERLLAVYSCPNRSSALRMEAAVKRLTAAAKKGIAHGMREWPTVQPAAAVASSRQGISSSEPLSNKASSAAGGAIE